MNSLMLFLRDGGSDAVSVIPLTPPLRRFCSLEAALANAVASEVTSVGFWVSEADGVFGRRNHSRSRGSSLMAHSSFSPCSASRTARAEKDSNQRHAGCAAATS